jgi:hypothetical protein
LAHQPSLAHAYRASYGWQAHAKVVSPPLIDSDRDDLIAQIYVCSQTATIEPECAIRPQA